MAVGRRKRLASGNQTDIASHIVYTAPAAPTDGSAAATVTTFTVVNNAAASMLIVVYVNSHIHFMDTLDVHETLVVPTPLDLQGGETVTVQNATTAGSYYYSLSGIVASDS